MYSGYIGFNSNCTAQLTSNQKSLILSSVSNIVNAYNNFQNFSHNIFLSIMITLFSVGTVVFIAFLVIDCCADVDDDEYIRHYWIWLELIVFAFVVTQFVFTIQTTSTTYQLKSNFSNLVMFIGCFNNKYNDGINIYYNNIVTLYNYSVVMMILISLLLIIKCFLLWHSIYYGLCKQCCGYCNGDDNVVIDIELENVVIPDQYEIQRLKELENKIKAEKKEKIEEVKN